MKEPNTILAGPLKVALAGVGIAAIGVTVGFAAWYLDSTALAKAGVFITIAGIVIGIAAIVVGQITHGRKALTGSVKAMREVWRKMDKLD